MGVRTMEDKVRILFVDDESIVLHAAERAFKNEGYEILSALSVEEGTAILRKTSPVHVVVSDYRMPGINGLEFLIEVGRQWPDTVRMILSNNDDLASVFAYINVGLIHGFITKPWNCNELRISIANSVERNFLIRRNRELIAALDFTLMELEKPKYDEERMFIERPANHMKRMKNERLTRIDSR